MRELASDDINEDSDNDESNGGGSSASEEGLSTGQLMPDEASTSHEEDNALEPELLIDDADAASHVSNIDDLYSQATLELLETEVHNSDERGITNQLTRNDLEQSPSVQIDEEKKTSASTSASLDHETASASSSAPAPDIEPVSAPASDSVPVDIRDIF